MMPEKLLNKKLPQNYQISYLLISKILIFFCVLLKERFYLKMALVKTNN